MADDFELNKMFETDNRQSVGLHFKIDHKSKNTQSKLQLVKKFQESDRQKEIVELLEKIPIKTFSLPYQSKITIIFRKKNGEEIELVGIVKIKFISFLLFC